MKREGGIEGDWKGGGKERDGQNCPLGCKEGLEE